MDARGRFMLVAGAVLAAFFVLTVVKPAIDRGGLREFGIVALIFVAILLVERWIRTR